MTKSVVAPAAAAHAKRLVRNKKLTQRPDEQQPAPTEQAVADKDAEVVQAVKTAEDHGNLSSMSETSLGNFSFSEALSGASNTASFAAAAQGDGGYSDDDGDGSGTLLLIGALLLVGAGIAVLVGGGGHKNDVPTFTAGATQALTTNEDTALTVNAAATDPDGDVLSYSVTTNPGKGTVTGGANGSFVYTPNKDYSGSDSFVVTTNDGNGGTATQTINVTVKAVNDAPTVAATATLAATEDTAATGAVTATDVDSTALTYSVSTQGAKGSAVIGADGKFTYTPNANANGTDTFVVTVADDAGAKSTQTVTVNIAAVNDAPTAAATATVATKEDVAATGSVGATDVDGDTLTYSVTTDGKNGKATVAADGTYTYAPNANFNGTDAFTIKVDDGKGSTISQVVTVTVTAQNDAPTAAATQALETKEDTAVSGAFAVTDVDGDTLTYSVVTQGKNGSVAIGADGKFTYSPGLNKNGDDSFVIKADDGHGGSVEQTVSVKVDAVADAPVLGSASQNIATLDGKATSGSIGATDGDGDVLTYAVTQGTHGTTVVNADGTFTYTPNSGSSGTDTVLVKVSDPGGLSVTQTINVSLGTSGPVPISLDIGLPTAPNAETVSGAATGQVFTNSINANSHVIITDFGSDDKIMVTDLGSKVLNFGSHADDARDLWITYQNTATGTSEDIIIDNVLSPDDFVSNSYASASAALGFDFITFA